MIRMLNEPFSFFNYKEKAMIAKTKMKEKSIIQFLF